VTRGAGQRTPGRLVRLGLFCCASFFLCSLAIGDSEGSGASANAVSHGSADGENAIKTFTFDGGLKCDLWAAEPLLANPVSFTEDEKGRWYVAETFRQERGVEDIRGHGTWLNDDIASTSINDRLWLMRKRVFLTMAKRLLVVFAVAVGVFGATFFLLPKRKRKLLLIPALLAGVAVIAFWQHTFALKFETSEDRICRLADTSGSGRANESVVFADGFKNALDGTGAGLIARNKSLWFACIPHLWQLQDTNDDGRAELKEKLLTGFGIRFAYRGHDMHGLRFGPDGKLYFSIGDRAMNVTSKEGQHVSETQTGSVMRCDPDGTHFEIFATGLRNPQELAFDAHGNLWTCDNDSDAGDASRFLYLAEGSDAGWRGAFQYLPDRGPWMREKPWDEKAGPQIRYILPCVLNVSNGPSGLSYNPGTGLSERYRNKFFLSDFRGGATASVVHEIGVEPVGAFFRGQHRDFIKGVLTTDVEFGNDGSLYVLDWVESWAGSGKGRIYKFTDPEADRNLQIETQRLIQEGMKDRPGSELARLLGHADCRVRQAAQFELAEKGQASVRILAEVAGDSAQPNPLARLHAIWGLGQLAVKDLNAVNALPALLADANAEVRAQAAKVLGDCRFTGVGDRLVPLLQHEEKRVRYFAALTLGKTRYTAAVDALCAMLAENDDQDPIVRHGGIMGLVGCGTAEGIASKSNDPSAAVRGAAVVALRRLESPRAQLFLNDSDESVVLEAARAIYDVPIPAALPALAALTEKASVTNPHTLRRALSAHYRLGSATNAQALVAFATRDTAAEALRREAIECLAAWAHPNKTDRVLNQWRPLPNRGNADAVTAVRAAIPGLLLKAPSGLQEAVIKLVASLNIREAGETLQNLAMHSGTAPAVRVEAIKALVSLKDNARVTKAAESAVTDADSEVRNQGLQALAKVDPAAAMRLAEKVINGHSVREKQGALLALAEIKNKDSSMLIGDLLDRLTAQTLPAEIQLDVIEAAKRQGSRELKDKVARYEAQLSATDDLAPWRVALTGGDAERGRLIFREKIEAGCIRCHRCEIGESQVGPDLTRIGATKDRAYLLESIVHPDKRIAEGYEAVILTLTDDTVIGGIVVGEDADSLRIRALGTQNQNDVTTVPRTRIKMRQRTPSAMPASLISFLSKSEIRDLVEYLATRQ
jgi:quinoprotein glucose dehydrogenase